MSKKELKGVKEIARRAGVSIATVDRVLHNRVGVSAKTREKINQIIEELNYQPNLMASRLASGKILRLAALIPSVSEETNFWEAPLKGIERAESEIRQYGVTVDLFLFDPNSRESFKIQGDKVLENNFDGLIIAPSFLEETSELAKKCDRKKLTYLFIDSNIPGQHNLSYIGPPLFQSGYLGAKLLTYRLKSKHKVLVVNISKEVENFSYNQIEAGFRSYFKDFNLENEIVRIDIRETDYESVARHLTYVFHVHHNIEAVFVTNSRVFSVASFLFNSHRKDIPLIGYDYLKENVFYLNEGIIDFLICHKPEEQGYKGVMTLYQNLVLDYTIPKDYFMPIDIVTRENQEFYTN